MQYDVTSPEAYLNALEDDWRKEKLLEIRSMILKEAPELIETISYKMLGYQFANDIIFALNAQKHYVSLYVGDISKVIDAKDDLAGFDMGKGCIRIKKTNNLPGSRLDSFIKNVLNTWRNGGDTTC